LNQSHDLINIHVNNWSSLHLIQGVPVPDVIEVTYIRRVTDFCSNSRNASIHNDQNSPNNADLPDFSSNFIDALKLY
jgi:hypothetical protein